MGFDQEWRDQQILNEVYDRWAKRRGETKVCEWRLTRATEARFQELWAMLSDCEEGSDAELAIQDAIQSLPGFPVDANPNTFTRRVLSDVQH